MIREVKFVPFTATYNDLNNLLLSTYHRSYPLVDNASELLFVGLIMIVIALKVHMKIFTISSLRCKLSLTLALKWSGHKSRATHQALITCNMSCAMWYVGTAQLSWNGFFFFVFFFAFPSYISGVHHFWVRFLRMWPFFNPTIKVVTFRLRGWCTLGVFLLLAFTCLGHERQDLLSPCDEMHVCTD